MLVHSSFGLDLWVKLVEIVKLRACDVHVCTLLFYVLLFEGGKEVDA